MRGAVLAADAFGVVGEKNKRSVFVDEARFNLLCNQFDGGVRFLDSADQEILADGFVTRIERGDGNQRNRRILRPDAAEQVEILSMVSKRY